jgi:hypothetical protein
MDRKLKKKYTNTIKFDGSGDTKKHEIWQGSLSLSLSLSERHILCRITLSFLKDKF